MACSFQILIRQNKTERVKIGKDAILNRLSLRPTNNLIRMLETLDHQNPHETLVSTYETLVSDQEFNIEVGSHDQKANH